MKNRYTEEEYREAAVIWRKQNPNIEVIPVKTVITISSNREVPIGMRLVNMRRNPEKLSNSQKEFWKDYGINAEKKSYEETEYQEAATIWKKQNPDSNRIPNNTVITIRNGKEIPVGQRMLTMRVNPETLTEAQKLFWKDYGLYTPKKTGKNRYTEEEFRKAAMVWKMLNPDLEMIPQKEIIEIDNKKEVPIGTKLMRLRKNIDKLTDEEKEFWKDYGLYKAARSNKDYRKELLYREAAKIWRQAEPNKQMIPSNTIITIGSGEQILLGEKMTRMRSNPEKLTEEQKEFWKEYGLFATNQALKDKYTEEEYKEAAFLWKLENRKTKKIPVNTVITISSGKKIPIGNKMVSMRRDIEKLTEEEKKYWAYFGLNEPKQSYKEEEYQEAAIIWKKQNPKGEKIPSRTVIQIRNGKKVPVGRRCITMTKNPEKLTKEQKYFWACFGVVNENEFFKEIYEYLVSQIRLDKSKDENTENLASEFIDLVKQFGLSSEQIKTLWANFALYIKRQKRQKEMNDKEEKIKKKR